MKISNSLLFIILVCFIPNVAFAQKAEDDLKYRRWRLTIIPPLSTNGLNALDYTARYSINAIGGIHGGLDGIEVGGLFNYNKYYANGFQIAGGANITGGEMAGVNFAGLTNISRYEMSGIQISGLANIAGDDLAGIQIAGALNVADGTSSGLQFSGLGNISTEDIEGVQGAGLFNAAWGDISGIQVAGVANIAKEDVEGLQVSGGINFAANDISGLQMGGGNLAWEEMEGLMISGVANLARKNASGLLITGGVNYAQELEGLAIAGGANFARELTGLQISGLLNASVNATGVQIGLINVAKEFEGLPVGFISFYGNGRKNIDIRYSDGGFTDLGINLGTHRVYNMILLGYNTLLNRDVYRIGWAIGLEKNIQEVFPRYENNSMYVNQEFSVAHHFEGEWDRTTNLIYSYKYLFGKRFGSGFSVYAGPSINMQVTRVDAAEDYTWYSLWSPSAKGRQYRFWLGFNLGFRIFKQKTMPLFKDQFDDWGIEWN